MYNKRVFVLGSGSSKGHSEGLYPLIDEFFSIAKRLNIHKDESFQKIENYTKEVLGKSIFTREAKIDIEYLFTLIEIEIERNPSPNLLLIRDELLLLIQKVLIILESELPTEGPSEYKFFVEKLKKNDTIITYNWDIVLDNFLGREQTLYDNYKEQPYNKPNKKAEVEQYKHFVNNLSAFSEMTWAHIAMSKPYEVWRPEKGYYIKAHGSVDWYYCSNEACRAFRKVFPVINPLTKQFCAECHETLDCLIIPPVLNKGYRNYPIIRKIWNIAAKELATTNELIIWGYSLPPTDFYTAWLLRQARKASLNKLVLINPAVINKTRKRLGAAFVKKFFDLFRDLIPKDSILLFETFTDYHNNQDIFSKYGFLSKKKLYNI